jgi:peptidoglycan/LPS O-acetylase OafA/YrhL
MTPAVVQWNENWLIVFLHPQAGRICLPGLIDWKPTRVPEERPFFTRIESLRGIGALAVAGWHMSGFSLNGVQLFPHVPWTEVGGLQSALGKIAFVLGPGHAGLMMFFVISGCVLRVSLQYGPQAWIAGAWRFAIARVFRIYPIVVAGTIVAAAVGGWQATATTEQPAGPLTVSMLGANMLLLDVSLNGTLWALQLEVLMAPVIVLLYFLERSYGTRVLIAAAAISTALSFAKMWAFWPPLSHHFFGFLVGMLIPTIGAQLAAKLSRATAQRGLVVSALTLVLAGQVIGFFSQISVLVETYAAATLISLVTYRNDLRGVGFLDAWPFRRLGLSSGSYYVLHMPLLPFALMFAALIVPVSWSATMPLLVGILVISASLVGFAPLMLVSYHLIEAPGIALGRGVIRWASNADKRQARPA